MPSIARALGAKQVNQIALLMPYSEKLSDRIREALMNLDQVEEKHMFGGVCYMVNGKMYVELISKLSFRLFHYVFFSRHSVWMASHPFLPRVPNYALRNDIRHIKKYLEKSRKTILR